LIIDEIIIEKRESDLNEIQLEINENILLPNTKEIILTPSKEEQIKEGLFNKVTVNAIDGDELIITPSMNEQIREGIFDKVIVNPIPGNKVVSKDIDFIDYDGTLLYSYTFDEIKNITELPPLPNHSGLICQEWNWSLEDIKNRSKELIVGTTYITDDGKTRIYIELTDEKELDMYFLFRQSKTNSVEVDWGDGSLVQTFNSRSDIIAKHIYDTIGEYVVTFNPINDATFSFGRDSSYGCCTGYGDSTGASIKMHYCADMITKVHLGKNFTFTHGAFSWCHNLQTITIPKETAKSSNEVFKECTSLKAVVIPNGCTELDNSFKDCSDLQYISLPNYIENITSNVFPKCHSLEKITFPETLVQMGGNLFTECASLKKVVMPDNLTTIGSSIFYNCYSLKDIAIPSGLTTFPSQMVNNCHLLKEVKIPNSVVDIKGTFYNCYGLKKVTLPNNITTVPNQLFYGCRNLIEVNIPEGLTALSSAMFYNCGALKNIKIPASINTIGNSTFDGCFGLVEIEVPETVTTIGSKGFYNCQSLTKITLSPNLISLGESSFYNCHSLKEIFIPKGITKMEGSFFLNCYNLQKIDFSTHTQIPVVSSSNAFASVPKTCKIIVPDNLYDDWKMATNWVRVADCIVKASEVA
jgi:hypothetical protein